MAEKWVDIECYQGIYQVSDFGRIRSLDRSIKSGDKTLKIKGRVLKPKNRNGYNCVNLSVDGIAKTVNIHRLVANSFVKKELGKNQINHINGNKTNNHYTNLEWCTCSENIQHYHTNNYKSSKFIGVYFHKGTQKYAAHIGTGNGKKRHIGLFNNEYDAHVAYQEKLKEMK